MMNNFKKIPLLISILGFIFLCTGLYFLYRQINLNNQKAEFSLTEMENETNRRDEVKLLNNSIETVKEDKALLGRHFAQSSDVVPFLDTIEGLAPKVGVKAETTSVDLSADNTGLIIKINTSGDFKNIYKFLTLLENSPYEIEVTSMDIQKEAGNIAPTDDAPVSTSKWQAVFDIKLLSFIQ